VSPDWTVINLVIQAIAGILGAHAAATAAREYQFGFVGHSFVGLLAGALSGFFLQRLAATMVTASGDAMPLSPTETIVVQVLTGAAAGGLTMLVAGFLRHEMRRKSGQ
jgi:hypothetical protein